jgi:hypothetical protein
MINGVFRFSNYVRGYRIFFSFHSSGRRMQRWPITIKRWWKRCCKKRISTQRRIY